MAMDTGLRPIGWGHGESMAQQTGARVATISTLTGGLPNADTYVAFVEANLRALVAAVGAKP